MANQPKKYKKFVASAATATLVASAIVPVASAATPSDIVGNDHEANILDLLELGYVSGKADGSFAPNEAVTRGQVVLMLGKWAEAQGLEVPADYLEKEYFNDYPSYLTDDNKKYYALVKAHGIFEGYADGSLKPGQNLSRVQLAVVLNSAYEAVTGASLVDLAGDTSDVVLGDIDSVYADYQPAVLAMKKLGITAPANFNPTGTVTRGQFASFLNATIKAEGVETKVTSVSATNATTLTITGFGLKDLKAEDITVADNTVVSVTASEDGKTATVKLGSELVVDEVTKVTVKEVSYDVNYSIEVKTVSVVEASYDDDTANQFIKIKIDGKDVTAQELINAGYSVSFDAYTTKAALTGDNTALFGNATSSTGELATDLATEYGPIPTSGHDVYVKVTLTKGSEVIVSPITKITIKNLDLAADSIVNAKLLNYGANQTADAGSDADFFQNSWTLVTGEVAVFDEITVKAGSDEDTVSSGFTVKSSDVSVISVDSTTGALTAQGPGTATITVTYGGANFSKAVTVKNEARKATKVTAEKTSISLTAAATVTTKVQLLDQYGDPMQITGGTNVVIEESNGSKVAATLGNTSDEDRKATLTLVGQNDGTGSSIITFRDASGAKIGTTSVKATVTDNDTLAKYSLAIDDSISDAELTALTAVDASLDSKDLVSKDATLDALKDKFLKINIKGLNSAGVEVSSPEVDGTSSEYTVDVNVSKDGVLDTTNAVYEQDGYILVKAGTEAGTATITVKNANNGNIVTTFKVTVEKVGYNVTSATLKNVTAPTYTQTLTYKNFLSYKAAEKDPTIEGITLSTSTAQPVRLDIDGDTGSSIGALYIDKDADGEFNNNDIIVGSVVITTTGTIADSGSYSDVVDGIEVTTGDDGSVLFKVLNTANHVVATKAVTVDF